MPHMNCDHRKLKLTESCITCRYRTRGLRKWRIRRDVTRDAVSVSSGGSASAGTPSEERFSKNGKFLVGFMHLHSARFEQFATKKRIKSVSKQLWSKVIRAWRMGEFGTTKRRNIDSDFRCIRKGLISRSSSSLAAICRPQNGRRITTQWQCVMQTIALLSVDLELIIRTLNYTGRPYRAIWMAGHRKCSTTMKLFVGSFYRIWRPDIAMCRSTDLMKRIEF